MPTVEITVRSNLQVVIHKVFFMKKIKFFILLITLSLFGCSSALPKVDSYYISSFTFTDDEKLWNAETVLSPDGENVIVDGKYLVNLKTGERENLYKRFNVGRDTTLKTHDILNGSAYWSSDGRYIGMLADHYEPTSISAVGEVTYIFDLQDNSFRRYETWSRSFSPFNSDQILTDKGVYNLNDGIVFPFLPEYDFRQEKEFGVTKYGVLWSKSLGIPVAEFNELPYNPSDNVETELAIETYFYANPEGRNYSMNTGIKFKAQSDHTIQIVFDPTGEYVLLAEWQCHESQISCEIYPFNADSVYDTVLTLVSWRTQEHQELIHLSEIDPEHVVAYGNMAWSADGSTIFISRKDAPPIVLKVK